MSSVMQYGFKAFFFSLLEVELIFISEEISDSF